MPGAVITAVENVTVSESDEMLLRLQQLQSEFLENDLSLEVQTGPITIRNGHAAGPATAEPLEPAVSKPKSRRAKAVAARAAGRKKLAARKEQEQEAAIEQEDGGVEGVGGGEEVEEEAVAELVTVLSHETKEFHTALLHNMTHALMLLEQKSDQIDLAANMTLGEMFVVGQPAVPIGEPAPVVATMLQQLYSERVARTTVTSDSTNREADSRALALVHRLISLGADVSSPSGDGLPPVYYAVMMRELSLLVELLQHNATATADDATSRFRTAALLLLHPYDTTRLTMATELLDINSELRRAEEVSYITSELEGPWVSSSSQTVNTVPPRFASRLR